MGKNGFLTTDSSKTLSFCPIKIAKNSQKMLKNAYFLVYTQNTPQKPPKPTTTPTLYMTQNGKKMTHFTLSLVEKEPPSEKSHKNG